MGKSMPGAIQADVRRRTLKSDKNTANEADRADALESQTSALTEEIESADARSASLLDESTAVGRALKAEKQRTIKLEAEKADLERKLVKMGIDSAPALATHDTEILLETALTELEAATADAKRHQDDLKAAQAKVKELETARAKAEDDRGKLDAELKQAEQRLKTESAKKETVAAAAPPPFAAARSSSGKTQQQLEDLLSQRNKAIETSTARGNRLEELTNKLRDERDVVEGALRAKTDEAAKLTAKIAEVEAEVARLRGELEAVETRCRTQIAAARDEATKLKNEAEALQRDVLAEKDRLSTIEVDRLKQEESVASGLQDELSRLQSAMNAKSDELATVRRQLTEAEANATKVRVPTPTPMDQALGQLKLTYEHPPWSTFASKSMDGKTEAVFNALRDLHRRAETAGVRLVFNPDDSIVVVSGPKPVLDGTTGAVTVANGNAQDEQRFALPLDVVQSLAIALSDGIEAALSLTEKLSAADKRVTEAEALAAEKREAESARADGDSELQQELEHERRKTKAFSDRVLQLNQQVKTLKDEAKASASAAETSSVMSGGTEMSAEHAQRLARAEDTANKLRVKVVKLTEQLSAAREENVQLLTMLSN